MEHVYVNSKYKKSLIRYFEALCDLELLVWSEICSHMFFLWTTVSSLVVFLDRYSTWRFWKYSNNIRVKQLPVFLDEPV
jgi:hypothetical protein